MTVPTGWVAVPALDVPDGGSELLALVGECVSSQSVDHYDIADALGIDPGLARYALARLQSAPTTASEPPASAPAAPVESSVDVPQSIDAAVVARAAEASSRLPSPSTASARLVLKIAAGIRPLTVERAKAITRLGGDDFEDILDDLVVSGELIQTNRDGLRFWSRSV